MAKNSSKLAGKIFPDAFNRADEIKQLPLAQLDQSIKELVKLGECVEILSGFAFKSDLFNTEKNGMPLIRIRDVVPAKTETYYSGDYLDDYLINNDDLLIGMDGDFNREKWQGGKALLNQRVCKISAVPSILDQDYLYHFLPKALLKIHSETPAVTVKHLSVKTIKEIEIPLPPLAEQKRIAAILDKADAIRRKRQQAIELADEFLRSVFLDMFGDPVTNPKGWDIVEIDQVCLDIVDCVNRTAPTVDYETPYKMIRTTNVRNYRINLEDTRNVEYPVYEKWTRRLTPSIGDIIFTREAPAGEAGIIETNDLVFLGQRTMHFRPNPEHTTSIFLLYELMSENLKKQISTLSSGSTVTHLSVPACKKFKIRKPPIELQREFAKRVEKVEALKAKLKASQLQAEEQFKALSQRAFAGEL